MTSTMTDAERTYRTAAVRTIAADKKCNRTDKKTPAYYRAQANYFAALHAAIDELGTDAVEAIKRDIERQHAGLTIF